jgi:hypothetical protein
VCRIFNSHNSLVWPAANSHSASVHWHQQHFSVNIWEGILHDFLIGSYLLPRWLSAQVYWALLEEKLPKTSGSSTRGLGLILHVRFHHLLQQLLDWKRRESVVWPPKSLGLLLQGHIKALIYTLPVDSEEDLIALIINTLPVQFKSLLHGQEGCLFFQWAFKFTYVPVRLSKFSLAGDI